MSENQLQTKPKTIDEGIAELSNSIFAELEVKSQRGLVLPDGYNVQNALVSAFNAIKNTVDKDSKPVLQTCKASSIKQSIWDMIDKGLYPSKKHVYFIAYGDVLTMIESYFGLVYRTKRADKNIKDVYAQIVYDKDIFKYEITHGAKKVTKHEQEPENVDINKIKGAYSTILYNDGTEVSEYMTIAQIRTSWNRSPTKGTSSAHKDQPDLMAKRTVLKRQCNITLNTETGDILLQDDTESIDAYAEEHESTEVVDITQPEPQAEVPKEIEKKEQLEIPLDLPDCLK